MAITVKQKQTGITGNYDGVTSEAESIEYEVITDNKYTSRVDIMNAGVLPVLYEEHPDNPLMTVRGIDLDQDAAPTIWTATVNYSSAPFDKDDKEDEEFDSPTDKPARIKWTTTQFTKPIFKDIDGEPIVNSATDYFDPPIEIDASRFSIVVEKNLTSVPAWVLTYANTINSSAFSVQGLTIGPKVAKLSELAISEQQTEQETDFYTVTFRLELATAEEEDWILKVLDQGLHEFDRAESKTPIQVDGEAAKQPVLLDGDGKAIVDPEPEDAVFLEFNGYVERDFSALPFT